MSKRVRGRVLNVAVLTVAFLLMTGVIYGLHTFVRTQPGQAGLAPTFGALTVAGIIGSWLRERRRRKRSAAQARLLEREEQQQAEG